MIQSQLRGILSIYLKHLQSLAITKSVLVITLAIAIGIYCCEWRVRGEAREGTGTDVQHLGGSSGKEVWGLPSGVHSQHLRKGMTSLQPRAGTIGWHLDREGDETLKTCKLIGHSRIVAVCEGHSSSHPIFEPRELGECVCPKKGRLRNTAHFDKEEEGMALSTPNLRDGKVSILDFLGRTWDKNFRGFQQITSFIH